MTSAINIINGTADGDFINDTSANDSISGLGGNDTVYGFGGGDDTINAGDGDDFVWDTSGNNSISGGEGNDTIVSYGGTETITGGAGNDSISSYAFSMAQSTLIDGGDGNDTYYVDNVGDVVVEGYYWWDNNGNDRVISSISYTLGDYIENLNLTGAADIDGTGNSLNNALNGSSGANHLWGLAGDDQLNGSAGNDSLYGGDGNDSLNGGADNDLLHGDAGTDSLNGGDGADVLYGDAGNDTLDGGTGADTMYGGGGNDTYYVDNIGDVVSEESAGAGVNDGGGDRVMSTISYTLGNFVENLNLLGSTDLNGTGNSLANGLNGNSGNNTLTGLGGNDTLNGGDGADTLVGGQGNDVLNGGNGADTFVFARAGVQNGVDTVQDFVHGTDQLLFTGSDYGFAAGHLLTASEFTTGSSAVGSGAQFVWNAATHTLYWDHDGAGGDAAIAIATFDSGATVTASDFHFG